MKRATTIDQQIAKLRKRGLQIDNEAKAEEILADIGYYRLGFYWFPFEVGYPNKQRRNHIFTTGSKFDDAVSLYYFDCDFRNLLAPYLHRIEVSFRTHVIYTVSNKYSHNPTWFVDPGVVDKDFVADFPRLYKDIRRNEAIKRHHHKYPNDIYAPAWKALEYMTFGSMLYMFEHLKESDLKDQIMAKFNFSSLDAFESQMRAIRDIRNVCAHGHNLYDFKFSKPIKVGALKGLSPRQRSNVSGALIIIANVLKSISVNRHQDFVGNIDALLAKPEFAAIQTVVSHISTIPEKPCPNKNP